MKIASDAAVRESLRRASSTEAAKAGTDAAASAIHQTQHRHSNAGNRDARPRTPGLVGRATDVQKTQGMIHGTTFFTLHFLLQSNGGIQTSVVMRGTILSGGIKEGDELKIVSASNDRGVLMASRILNLSTGVEVRAGVGPLGRWNWARAEKLGRAFSYTLMTLVVIAVAVGAIVGVIAFSKHWSTSHEMATVPNVVGMDRIDAMDELTRAGLNPVLRQEENSSVRMGNVIRQSPTSGHAVTKKSDVYLYWSIGAH